MCKRVILYTEKIPLFDKYQIEKDLERSIKRKVWIKNGGYLLFDHAEALLAIDINTGRNLGKKNLEDTIFQTNMSAAQEICRQLRLRDIGGLIVVDFIDMQNPENRRRLEREMRTLLAKDPTTTSCTGLSKFGLMEITRKRVRPELQELFTNICHACNGLGRVFSPATVTARIDRWLRRADKAKTPKELMVTVSSSVATYIQKENSKLITELVKAHGISLEIVVDESLDQDEFEIFQKGDRKPITEKYA
jgi:ribonuclease G